MSKIVKIIGGVLCGCALSQYPEFSQQYVQRMGGALDELNTVVSDFDTSAAGAGYTREAALEAMTGTEFLDARQNDMRNTFKRFDTLSEDYARLSGANAYTRLAYFARFRDGDIVKGTTKDFKPAVPLSVEGIIFVAIGFVIGFGLVSGIMRLFRRKKKQAVEL